MSLRHAIEGQLFDAYKETQPGARVWAIERAFELVRQIPDSLPVLDGGAREKAVVADAAGFCSIDRDNAFFGLSRDGDWMKLCYDADGDLLLLGAGVKVLESNFRFLHQPRVIAY